MTDELALDTFQERVGPVQESLEAAIDSHRTEIERLSSLRETIREIADHAAHYDSVACGSINADEINKYVELGISAYELDSDIREIVTEYEWDNVEVFWDSDAELWQVELTLSYNL
jgi:hypothetical protein